MSEQKEFFQILEDLKTEGGAIVLSSECSPMEIAFAQANGRLYIDQNGFGYIRRSKDWLGLLIVHSFKSGLQALHALKVEENALQNSTAVH